MTDRKTTPRIQVEDTSNDADQLAADLFTSVLCESVADRQVCHIALSGGTTPHPLYEKLTDPRTVGEMPWASTEIFFGDERDVPHDHADSNYRMAQRTLLDHLPIDPQSIHPMPADAENLEAAAADYERVIRETVPAGDDGIPRFDLILLGMGTDGHVASLFPGTDALNEMEKLVIAHHVAVLGRDRMTITFPLINAARNVLLLVTGSDKAAVVRRLLGDKKAAAELPAGRIDPADGEFTVILDADAARALER